MEEHIEETTNEQAKHYVYFVAQAESRFIKIGATADVTARVRQLQTGNPQRLIILRTIEFESADDARSCEALLHERYRSLGLGAYGEWFAMCPASLLSDVNFALELGRRIDCAKISDFPDTFEAQHFIREYNQYSLHDETVDHKGGGKSASEIEKTFRGTSQDNGDEVDE